jgi:signal peptidase II
MKRSYAALAAIIIAAVLVLDRAFKLWTTANLELGQTHGFMPGFIELLRLHNYGAAWSSFSGMRWVLVGVTAAVIIALLAVLLRGVVKNAFGVAALALIIAGGLGNLIDRAAIGYVVDMLHFQFWQSFPVFNVADIAVVFGGIMAVVYYLFMHDRAGK